MKGKNFNNSLHSASYPFLDVGGDKFKIQCETHLTDFVDDADVYCFPVFRNLSQSLEPSFQSSQCFQTAASAALGVAHLAA